MDGDCNIARDWFNGNVHLQYSLEGAYYLFVGVFIRRAYNAV